MCDRIIRACNQRLGSGTLDPAHQEKIVELVELAVQAFESLEESGMQSNPFYLEKIVFHILQKVTSLGAHSPACRLGAFCKLHIFVFCQQTDDFHVLVRNCFAVLWNSLQSNRASGSTLLPRDRLHCQLQALTFKLLEQGSSSASFPSKVPLFVEEAVVEYERSCGGFTHDDVSFLSSELRELFFSPLINPQDSALTCLSLAVQCEVVFKVCKLLCKSLFSAEAVGLLSGALEGVDRHVGLRSALSLADHAVQLQSALSLGGECSKAFTESAHSLRGLPRSMSAAESHALLEACQLVVWAMEAGQCKGMDVTTLLACLSFLEEYQELLLTQQKVSLYNNSLPLSCRCIMWMFQVNRCFMLTVQCSRRGGQLERALDWIVRWIQVLGTQILDHFAEPVSLWVKTKCDAARAGEDDTRLRTLRDGLGEAIADEKVMMCLSEEELRLYKEQTGDTAQERYNTLCDLLDICHEETPHTLRRATYLCEMAQVVCYQDFSQQTDCSAVDFTHEALRLLDSEPETAENADRLMDEKAHASLWLYICTLETNLQEAVDTEKRLRAVQEENKMEMNMDPVPTNDLEYEDKQKSQESQLVYDGLCFNLLAQSSKCLSLWRSLLKGSVPAVRDPKLTASSMTLMAALYTLMGKTLVLYTVFVYLLTVALISLSQVERGVCCLMEVIKESAQHHSKSWYLLRARTLQTASEYLSLDTETLDSQLRQSITQHGLKTPDTAQYEGLKLLCSLVMMLLGNGFYGAPGPNTDTHFVDQGDSVVFKWLLLSEVLVSSERMVTVRSSSGAVHEAKAQCLEALKLATKLQTLSHCAELLVLKAELELMKGANEASSLDLDQVRNLLDLCTDFGQGRQQKSEVKIKPRKGRPAAPSSSGHTPEEDDDLSGILSSRALLKEPVETMSRLGSQGASPPLKPKRQHVLSCLTHADSCSCPCCSELSVARVSIHWALLQADLQTDPEHSRRLRQYARKRCRSVAAKLQNSLAALMSSKKSTGLCLSLLKVEQGKVHLGAVLQLLSTGDKGKATVLWEEIGAGLEVVTPKEALTPELGPIRAALLGAKAVACCLALAMKKQCAPEELFSSVWGWNPPKIKPKTESKHRSKSPVSDTTPPETGAKCRHDMKSASAEQESRKTKDDTEAAPVVEKSEKKKNASISKTSRILKPALNSIPSDLVNPTVEPEPPRRTRTTKKSTALSSTSCLSPEEETGLSSQTRTRRGRPKKSQSSEATEEPERMRMIKEDDEVLLNISLEELRGSDTEINDTGVVFFSACYLGLSKLSVLITIYVYKCICFMSYLADLSVEAVQSYLRSSWLLLHHFPPPSLFPHICSLLAQSLGQTDPITTAMLHAQSLGVSTRHHMTRHVVSQKLKKSCNDVAEGLGALSLEETSGATQSQKLSALEQIFSFTSSHPTQFPQTHCQQFTQQLKDLPAGITVCMLSLTGVYPDEIGSTILLTRLERGSTPITVRIPTADRKRSVAVLLEEMDRVLKGQKEVSTVAEKSQWWEGRKALDARVEKMLEEMEEALRVWRTLLLPLSSDPELEVQVKCFQKALKGTKITQDILKVCGTSLHLYLFDRRMFPPVTPSRYYFFSEDGSLSISTPVPARPAVYTSLICKAITFFEPSQYIEYFVFLQFLQRLPWENIACLKSRSVTRMPSLHAVLGHGHLKEMDSSCVLSCGVNPKKVYYVLNPDRNLPDTENRFKEWFTNERAWQGVCGTAPDPDKLQEAVTTKDLYIYIGHGAGARFLDAQRVLKGPVQAVALLFGCSSAALSVLGHQEGTGIILSYLTAGCPLVLGNLWDVTDRDLDRFTSALLQSWLSAGSGSSLLQHLTQSRNATHLKHIIGAAPIAYGLPAYIH
uniref:separase n=1 Tax=Sinocyclocheilus anshuiensis TaxID=1608454 RepID=A0A671RHH8_9TELE